jgi:hypothetical protein
VRQINDKLDLAIGDAGYSITAVCRQMQGGREKSHFTFGYLLADRFFCYWLAERLGKLSALHERCARNPRRVRARAARQSRPV